MIKLSLGRKIVLVIILIAVVLSGTCIFVSGMANRKTMDKEYMITADSMAWTSAVMLDGDSVQEITEKVMEIYRNSDIKLDNTQYEDPRFESYVEQYSHLMEDEDYIAVQEQLRKIQDVSEVDCIYTVCIVPEDKTAVYIVDGAYGDELVPAGCFDFLEEESIQYINTPEKGLPAFISHTEEYGYMATAGAPIYNSSGEIVCLSMVDLSMSEVLAKENRFLLALAGVLLILTFIICMIAIVCVNQSIVKPINMLSETAKQYGQKQSGIPHHEFSSLNIHTGDELEILLKSMMQMENDIDSYIESLTKTKQQLSSARQQADDMHELAHMDSLTGIRNRLAYDKEIIRLDEEIQKGLCSFGIAMIDLNFLKRINDTYGHECGNSAIIALSQLICEVFIHSPVFRIGGDEFAVILKNHDYNKIKCLEQRFNQCIATFRADTSLQPWEKISAAFGYALFDAETDSCADDVFKRADQKMYERKKEMKAIRK
ncbi:MAG TPA: hypothetical protein DCO72_11370 [Ruminococcus sp.]|nr:hypothetical protein [Ruminococcus sp.]